VLSKERERPGRGAALAAAIAQVERRIRRIPSSAPRWPGLSSPVVVRKARVRRSPFVVLYAELADELVVWAWRILDRLRNSGSNASTISVSSRVPVR
jgi:hypothetical protein